MSDNKTEVPYLTFEELQNEFQTWSSQHGDYDEMQNGMPFYRIKHYPTAMNALVLRFIEIGYSEKQIRGQVISLGLQTFCTSFKHPNKEKWKLQIKRFWDFAVNQRFPSTQDTMEAKIIENVKAETVIDQPKPKKTETIDMTKYEGFGRPLRKDIEEDILAELDEGSNE